MADETSRISLLLSERVDSLGAERDTLVVRPKTAPPRKYPLRSLREVILLHACTLQSDALAALADANVALNSSRS